MADLQQYKCPNCSGRIEFDSASQRMVCPYCGSSYDVAEFTGQFGDDTLTAEPQTASEGAAGLEPSGPDAQWQMQTGEWDTGSDGLLHYVCQSCGGEIVADQNTAATRCPYCDNPVTVSGQLAGTLRPDLVIPFKLDKEAAKAKYKEHIGGKRLLPKVFSAQNHIDEIQGVYVPFWLFNADVDARFVFDATRSRSYTRGEYQETETDHFDVTRCGTMRFQGVPADGSSRMADDLMDSIEPFNPSEAQAFSPAYLSGYLAERYDVSAEQCFDRAKERITNSAETVMRNQVSGFSSVQVRWKDVRVTEGNVQYALYPVWLLNTTWNGEKYIFAMNGQTGKMVGDLPCDNGLYWKYVLSRAAIIAVAAFGALAALHFFM